LINDINLLSTFEPVKKVITIALLFVFLESQTEWMQIFRIPVLVHHFLEHRSENPNESLVEFLNNHYSSNQNHSSTSHHRHDHDNLPFKSADGAKANVTQFFIDDSSAVIPIPFFSNSTVASTSGIFICLKEALNSIWQPPQFS
jgi:hypothetical protein